ncbi:MAG TPA: succinate dehydrogenase cytochrome b subunit [Myxococcales bacterium]|jgi:succinate dehydrogenase / fumarate reductase cytochrome b subunit
MRLFSDSIGRKAVMATTGLLMILFVVVHMLGNLTIFGREAGINAYAEKLQSLPPLVWTTRVVMGTSLVLHVILAVIVTLENWKANPIKYAVNKALKVTFAGKTMIWTGILIGAFLGYHLLQFTIHAIPGLVLNTDALHRPDVFGMVFHEFRITPIVLVYVASMVALFLHLSHGIQSVFQTFGWSNAFLLPKFELGGRTLSMIFLVGFGAIPVCILIGLLTK